MEDFLMARKPTYEELEQSVEYLESELAKYKEDSSESFKNLVDRSLDGIYHFDIQLPEFTLFNQSFFKLFKSKEGDKEVVTTKSVLFRIHPEYRDKVRKAAKESLVQGRESGEIEYFLLHHDGSLRWMHDRWYVIRDMSGKPIAIEGIVRDDTERKQAEEALRSNEAKYKRLVEGSPDIVWSFSDKKGTFYASAQVEAILGYSPDYLYKNPWLWNKSIHPDDQDQIAKAIGEFIAGKDLDVVYRIKNASGNWQWFHDRSIGRRMEGDEAIIEGISMDITERKRARGSAAGERRIVEEHLPGFADRYWGGL
jgi:PAS domain S-box-containing protein